MSRAMRTMTGLVLAGVALMTALSVAGGGGLLTALGVAGEGKKNSAVVPVPRMDKDFWKQRHEKFLARAKQGEVNIVFLGDSITQGWEGRGKKVWEANFEPLKAVNFGISGDRTEHVLWRITEGGELQGIEPKLAVVMIGTNNTGANTAPEIIEGITAIVKELGKQKPNMKVLLLGVFPRSAKADDPVRKKIVAVNQGIAQLHDGKRVFFLDIGKRFLQEDGTLTKEIMPDLLHLSERGYEIWAEAIIERVRELMK
jgi:lysophospholipase L1-like esterase